jgi:heavy metal sensor kinase
MRRSIRWALIGWFGLLLASVLAVYGAVLLDRGIPALTLDHVDAWLAAHANAFAAVLRWEPDEKTWDFDIRDEYLEEVAEQGYFRIWGPKEDAWEILVSGNVEGPKWPTGTDGLRWRGDLRELEIAGPDGSRIFLGRSTAPERAALASLRTTVVVAGLAVLALALAGGAWLARRALAPVASLSAKAKSIGARNLSERLDEQACPVELRDLASSFNGTLERLEVAFARQARFTADASHELRTPVAIVRTQADQALLQAGTPEEYRAALGACSRAAQRMGNLVERLLRLARADADEEAVRRESVDFGTVVREGAELLRRSAEAADVELRCEAVPVRVGGDPRLLADVVSNLVENAVRYNRRGGRVDVSLVRENGEAVLRVSDTGIGIPPEAQSQIFERFYRVDRARSGEHGGSGLGLSIVRWIVQAHGGSIGLESRVDEGSTFTVRLPLDAGGAERPESASSSLKVRRAT